MGLDIYAGTFTRYYAHNWKTVVQQYAEENGYAFHCVTPRRAEPEEELSPAEIQEVVEVWRDRFLAAVNQSVKKSYAPWAEDNVKPYFTDKPGWDALGAMLLVAAGYSYGEPVPTAISKDWEFMEHPLIRRLSEDKEKTWSLFRDATCWLPLQDSFMLEYALPTGCQAGIATTAALRRELEAINSLAWQADEKTICSWRFTEGYPGGETEPNSTSAKIPENAQYDTQSMAKLAFSIFYQALKFAEENQVPILLDY